MPLLTVSLASKTLEEIMKLVERGLYSGVDQFMDVAALNQLALERGASPDQLREQGHRAPPALAQPTRALAVAESRPKHDAQANGRPARPSRAPVGRHAGKPAHLLDGDVAAMRNRTSLLLALEVGPDPLPMRSSAEDDHIWGQVNRVFAMKFVARWLAVTSSRHTRWPKAVAAAHSCTADAAVLGSALEQDDAKKGRKRDELFATGLPRLTNMPSMDRFQSQYVARITRRGEIYPGAICHYGLANFDGDEIGLTTKGLELARLHNPILDSGGGEPTSTLTTEERAFFHRLIAEWVPAERQDFETVLGAIAAGSNTPEDLLATVHGVLPDGWSPVVMRTHVSGVVARLSDLGLVRRTWEGRHVTYGPTDEAGLFLTKSMPPGATDAH